ncbi:hypothetical protein [Streptomyces sp. NPDC007088]|uniref:hypothetical protein n=1 Tax=Streptomyces sp. NPDC007088 TaxID=3364773 RepID=UPI003693AC7E
MVDDSDVSRETSLSEEGHVSRETSTVEESDVSRETSGLIRPVFRAEKLSAAIAASIRADTSVGIGGGAGRAPSML